MERGEEKKWMEERASTRTHAWRARVVGLFREWRVRVMCACAQVGFVPEAQRWRGAGTTLWKMYGGWNFSIRAYARIGARAWMVENAGSARTRHVRVRVDGALFFNFFFFYVFAPIQAFQTSKQLPKHHKTLFNILKLPNILN